jgi:glycosyltransferase involved in cell wall biosynthesis
MDTGIDVSVVVATYNRCAGLEELLRALASQTYPASRFEVVVIDDGSTDGTRELLQTIDVPYALRSFHQANSGPAAARNLGVRHARGAIILFLDDDVVPVPRLIAAHEAAHGLTTMHVVTGPMLAPPAEWPQPSWDRWDAAQLEKQYRAMTDGDYPCTQRQFFTANASVHRHLFDAAGGFDPAFRRAEDMELAWRMSRHGARFIFEPNAEVVHYAARTFESWRRNPYQYGRYDVVMEREKSIPVLTLACREFGHRRAVNRWIARLCVDRPMLRDLTLSGLSLAVAAGDRCGARRMTSFVLSSIFNIQYWQGASDELGGAARLWNVVDAGGGPDFAVRERLVEHVDVDVPVRAGELVSATDSVGGNYG